MGVSAVEKRKEFLSPKRPESAASTVSAMSSVSEVSDGEMQSQGFLEVQYLAFLSLAGCKVVERILN